MPNQVITSVENNFTKGLVTEFTGMNFPENAAIDCDNTEFTVVGDTVRRLGVDFENNYSLRTLDRTLKGVNSYKWNNVGGDGNTQFVVIQSGDSVYFYNSSAATTSSGLSAQFVTSLLISDFVATGATFTQSKEATFADGNGYLFIFHPDCDPIYVSYSGGSIGSSKIIVQIRDFIGIPETGVDDTTRPSSLSVSHNYNIINQGWTQGNPWSATSTTSVASGTGAKVFTVAGGITGISGGQSVLVTGVDGSLKQTVYLSGTVTSYAGTTLTLSISSVSGIAGTYSSWTIVPINTGYINTWLAAVGNYPSNSDQWWRYKNTSNTFDPATTIAQVTISGAAPKAHFILRAFEQYRTSVSTIAGITDITTVLRPSNGTWFQGRIWYTGVNASFAASGTAPFTTWTSNIYFSTIVQGTGDFGKCYQTNDPTSENLFDILPTDGGIISIPEAGSIYKLFPIQNGMLIFAANGIWFLTGSQGIGFAANDYTITKISSVRSISSTSYVDVQGLPYFWNEEGIYQVIPAQQGGLEVNPITVGTILSFYNEIPTSSKKYARGAYDPIDYVIKWAFKSTVETDVTDRYFFNRILNFNTFNKSFFPYTVDQPTASWPAVSGLVYVASPGSSSSPDAKIKYLTFAVPTGPYQVTFSDEKDTTYVDWFTFGNLFTVPRIGVNYDSFFITGYKLHGQAQRRFQIPFVYMFSRTNGGAVAYKIQGRWDYANTGNSGRWSTLQYTTISDTDFDTVFRRHRLRGQGLVLQIKVTSVDGQPYDIIGWSAFETQNMSI